MGARSTGAETEIMAGTAMWGRSVEVSVIDISEVENGKITHIGANADLAGVM